MCENKPLKFTLVVVFMLGVSNGASATATPSNPVSDVSSPGTITFTTEQAASTTRPTDTPKIELAIAGFYSGRSGHWDGSGMRPAVELALKHVNNKTDILEKYELHVYWKDSRCDPADGVWTFHSHLVEEPKKIMLIGPPCSTDAEPVAQTSEKGNLVTMSYSAASPALSNRERHPYFFRTYKTDLVLNRPRIWLFNHFNWTRIGSIHQNIDLFTLSHSHLYELLSGSNITVEVKEIYDERPSARQIETMKNEDIKIILASAYEAPALELFCKAYQKGLYGKGYVWILLGWYSNDWYRNGNITHNCTSEQVETAVEESMYISMEPANFSETPDDMTVAGYSANEIKRQLEEECWDETATASGLEMFGYDALWAIALALNRTDEALAKDQYELGRLENFSYNANDTNARELASMLFKEINSTSFSGASGHVDLPFGDQYGIVNIEQLQPYCDKGWHLFNISCYKLVNEKRNWTDSRQYCKDLATEKRSHLASILSQEESTFLRNRTKGSWYIGLTYNPSSDELNWVDTKKSHVEWWPQSFDSKEENSRCYVWKVETGSWEPSDCKRARHFICRRRASFKEESIVTLSANESGASVLKWNGRFMWYDDEVPTDQTQPVEEGLQRDAFIVLAVCASLGIVLAISFLTFNILARDHRIVKLSSPNLNNLIVVGCILIYVSICILGLEVVRPNKSREPVDAFCMLRLWFISVGFVLGFGAIFGKIWRVYKVANFKHGARKVVIKDSELFGLVGILLLPDVILLVLWTFIDPLEQMPREIDMDSYVQMCECEHFNIWAILLCLYKGLILVIGVFLAWETRNVTIAALNDSKSIGLCIYTTTLLCVIGVATAIPFPDVPAYQYLITSACMLFCTTFILLVVFVPKIWFVYKPAKFDRKSSTATLHSSVPTQIQSISAPIIEIGGTDNNGNAAVGPLALISKPFTSRREQSCSVEDQTNRVQETTACSIDEVFE